MKIDTEPPEPQLTQVEPEEDVKSEEKPEQRVLVDIID